jgi:hypothetical protein
VASAETAFHPLASAVLRFHCFVLYARVHEDLAGILERLQKEKSEAPNLPSCPTQGFEGLWSFCESAQSSQKRHDQSAIPEEPWFIVSTS